MDFKRHVLTSTAELDISEEIGRVGPIKSSAPAGGGTARSDSVINGSWLVAVCASSLIVALAVSIPWVNLGWGVLIKTAFASICHQIPKRSFELSGVHLAVCHRCLGIYLGILAGLLFAPAFPGLFQSLVMHRRQIILLSLSLVFFDWGLDVVGIWSNSVASRVATGLQLGVVGGLILAQGVMELGVHRKSKTYRGEAHAR